MLNLTQGAPAKCSPNFSLQSNDWRNLFSIKPFHRPMLALVRNTFPKTVPSPPRNAQLSPPDGVQVNDHTWVCIKHDVVDWNNLKSQEISEIDPCRWSIRIPGFNLSGGHFLHSGVYPHQRGAPFLMKRDRATRRPGQPQDSGLNIFITYSSTQDAAFVPKQRI